MSSPSLPRAANGLGRPGAPVGGRPSLRDAVCAHFKRPAKERGPERRLLKDSFPRKQMAPLMRLPKKWPQCPRQTKENTEDAFTVAPRRISVTDIRSPFGSFFFFRGVRRKHGTASSRGCRALGDVGIVRVGNGEVALKICGSHDTVDLSHVRCTASGKIKKKKEEEGTCLGGEKAATFRFDSYDFVIFSYVSIRLVPCLARNKTIFFLSLRRASADTALPHALFRWANRNTVPYRASPGVIRMCNRPWRGRSVVIEASIW